MIVSSAARPAMGIDRAHVRPSPALFRNAVGTVMGKNGMGCWL